MESADQKEGRRRIRRVLIAVVLGLIGLEALYVAGTAIAFSTGWFSRMVSESQEDVVIEVERAWSLWPGDVNARGLTIRGHDSHVQWVLEFDEVETFFSPLALLRRELIADGVEGRGITFRLRGTRPHEELCAAGARALPPIEGEFSPPPAKEGKKRCLEEAAKAPKHVVTPVDLSKMWKVHLSNAHARDVRELWIEHYRFQGQADIDGGFFLYPTQAAELETTTVSIESGRLTRGEKQKIAEKLRGNTTLKIDRFDVPEIDGGEIFRMVSADGELGAHVRSLTFLNRVLRSSKRLHIERGGGVLAAKFGIDHGKIQAGTDVKVTSGSVSLRLIDDLASGSGYARFTVTGTGKSKPLGKLDLELDKWESRRAGDEKPYLRGTDLHVSSATRDLDLVDPFDRLDTHIKVPKAFVPDFRVYSARIPAGTGLKIRSGTATVSGEVHIRPDDQLDDGVFFMTARGIGVEFRKLQINGDLDIDAHFASRGKELSGLDITGTVAKIHNGSVTGGARGWWATANIERGIVAPSDELHLDATMRANMRDVRPLLEVYSREKSLPGWVKGVLALEDARTRVRVAIGRDLVAIPELHIRGGAMDVSACARITEQSQRAALLLAWSGLAVGLDVVNGNTDINILSPTSDYQKSSKEILAAIAKDTRTRTSSSASAAGIVAPRGKIVQSGFTWPGILPVARVLHGTTRGYPHGKLAAGTHHHRGNFHGNHDSDDSAVPRHAAECSSINSRQRERYSAHGDRNVASRGPLQPRWRSAGSQHETHEVVFRGH